MVARQDGDADRSPLSLKIVDLKDIPYPEAVMEVDLSDALKTLKLAKKMEVLCVKKSGIGLAAVQVGVPLHFFIAQVADKFEYFANCTYKPIGAETFMTIEGCLSIPNRFFRVKRYQRVLLSGCKLRDNGEFEEFDRELVGMSAAVVQHEVDHGYGILVSQLGQEVEVWKNR